MDQTCAHLPTPHGGSEFTDTSAKDKPMKFGVIILPSHRWNDAQLPSEWADEIALTPR
jgi:hypothetical protein